MKLKQTTLLATLILLSLSVTAFGSDRAINGLILGGGSGALMGQAIGRNSESTIIGAAVGGILGYIIGNNSHSHGHDRYSSETRYSGDEYYHHRHRPRLKEERYRRHHRPAKSRRDQPAFIRHHGVRKHFSHRDRSPGFENRDHRKTHDRYYRR